MTVMTKSGLGHFDRISRRMLLEESELKTYYFGKRKENRGVGLGDEWSRHRHNRSH